MDETQGGHRDTAQPIDFQNRPCEVRRQLADHRWSRSAAGEPQGTERSHAPSAAGALLEGLACGAPSEYPANLWTRRQKLGQRLIRFAYAAVTATAAAVGHAIGPAHPLYAPHAPGHRGKPAQREFAVPERASSHPLHTVRLLVPGDVDRPELRWPHTQPLRDAYLPVAN